MVCSCCKSLKDEQVDTKQEKNGVAPRGQRMHDRGDVEYENDKTAVKWLRDRSSDKFYSSVLEEQDSAIIKNDQEAVQWLQDRASKNNISVGEVPPQRPVALSDIAAREWEQQQNTGIGTSPTATIATDPTSTTMTPTPLKSEALQNQTDEQDLANSDESLSPSPSQEEVLKQQLQHLQQHQQQQLDHPVHMATPTEENPTHLQESAPADQIKEEEKWHLVILNTSDGSSGRILDNSKIEMDAVISPLPSREDEDSQSGSSSSYSGSGSNNKEEDGGFLSDDAPLSDIPSNVDSVTRDRYMLACRLLKTTMLNKERKMLPLERNFMQDLITLYGKGPGPVEIDAQLHGGGPHFPTIDEHRIQHQHEQDQDQEQEEEQEKQQAQNQNTIRENILSMPPPPPPPPLPSQQQRNSLGSNCGIEVEHDEDLHQQEFPPKTLQSSKSDSLKTTAQHHNEEVPDLALQRSDTLFDGIEGTDELDRSHHEENEPIDESIYHDKVDSKIVKRFSQSQLQLPHERSSLKEWHYHVTDKHEHQPQRPQRMNRVDDKDRESNIVSEGETVPFKIFGVEQSQPHTRILTPSLMEAFRGFFPIAVAEANFWLKYSLQRDGASLSSLLLKVNSSTNTILSIETDEGDVFGAFCSSPWRVNNTWYGSGESFLWRLKLRSSIEQQELHSTDSSSQFEVYPFTGHDDFVQYCTTHTIAVGGGNWNDHDEPNLYKGEPMGIGFMIDGDLMGGETNSCATFANPRLCGRSSRSNEFNIHKLEVWTLTYCSSVKEAETLENQKLFIEKNSTYYRKTNF